MGNSVVKFETMDKVLKRCKLGDVLEFESWNGEDIHYAVYAGNGSVIHLVDDIGQICLDSIIDRFHGASARINNGDMKVLLLNNIYVRESSETIDLANTYVDKEQRDIPWRNCEEFATWCKFQVVENWHLMSIAGERAASLFHQHSIKANIRDKKLNNNDIPPSRMRRRSDSVGIDINELHCNHSNIGEDGGYYRNFSLLDQSTFGFKSGTFYMYILCVFTFVLAGFLVFLHHTMVTIQLAQNSQEH